MVADRAMSWLVRWLLCTEWGHRVLPCASACLCVWGEGHPHVDTDGWPSCLMHHKLRARDGYILCPAHSAQHTCGILSLCPACCALRSGAPLNDARSVVTLSPCAMLCSMCCSSCVSWLVSAAGSCQT